MRKKEELKRITYPEVFSCPHQWTPRSYHLDQIIGQLDLQEVICLNCGEIKLISELLYSQNENHKEKE